MEDTRKQYSSYIVVFTLLWIANSYFMQNMVSGLIRSVLPFAISIFLWICIKNKDRVFEVERQMSYFCIFAILNYFISMFSSLNYKIDNNSIIYFLLTLFSAMLLTECCSFEEFIESFCNVMEVICCVSIILYFINLLVPGFLSIIPNVFKTEGRNGAGILYFYTFYCAPVTNYYRSNGMFVETGMYQIYINLFFIFELFYKEKISTRRVVICIIAYLTGLSSTGLVIMLLVITAFLLERKTLFSKEGRRIVLLIICMLVVTVYILSTLGIDAIGQLLKVQEVKTTVSYGRMSSGGERLRSFTLAIKAWLEHPIIGCGQYFDIYVNNITGGYVILTCTPINFFARFGIFGGIIYNALYLKILKYLNVDTITQIILAAALILMLTTQAFEINIVMMCFWFWGFDSYKIQEEMIENEKIITD